MEGGPNIQEEEQNLLNSEIEEGRCSPCWYAVSHPNGKLHRFVALLFMCFLGFGSYFCYDNPSALQDHIEKDLNLTDTQYAMLYSIYSWPNVILCFIGGFLIDRVFGIRLGTNIYQSITLIGQILFATGGMLNHYWLMILGRFVFGIGAESLAVAQNNYAVLWFKGKELNMVFGLQLSFARIGSTVSFMVMEHIYKWVHTKYPGAQGLGISFYIATLTCVFSMACSLILGFMDNRAERILNRAPTNSEEVRITDVKDFRGTFWLLTVICVFYYVAIFPFIGFGKKFFITIFDMHPDDANNLISLVYLISGIASPFLGFLIDKVGRNLAWIFIGICFTIVSHILFAFCTQVNPYVGIAIMGLAYSTLASGLWPLVSLIVPEKQLGTAFGVCQAVQNLGLAVFAILAGVIVDNYNFTWLEVFFISSLGVALFATILLWIFDYIKKGTLNMTPKARKEHQQSILAAQILEQEKLISAGIDSASSSEDLFHPNSDFHIRIRYLSRIGAPLPPNYSVNSKRLTYRSSR